MLFCDLVSASALSERLDPEDLRDVLREFQRICGTAIRRFEGHVAQYLGDGVLAYFGYPAAQEDSPQRAVRAGLALLRAMGSLAGRMRSSHEVELSVRVGIHTGMVVVGEMGDTQKQEKLAVGETPNIAARIQNLAKPGTVVVSDATHRLVRGFFSFDDLGSHDLKGFSHPMPLHAVIEETTARSRLDLVAQGELTPFVGRENEVQFLQARWAEAKAGAGPVVLLGGEPGIGKSRHVRVLKTNLAADRPAVFECFCSPLFQATALYPVTEMLDRSLRLNSLTDPADKLAALEAAIQSAEVTDPLAVPLIASLLGIPYRSKYLPLDMLPQRQRQATFEVLATWLYHRAKLRPVLFIVEDIHWADPSTLELFGLVIQRPPSGRLMLLLTRRPEMRPPWRHERITELNLQRLPIVEAQQILASVARAGALPDDVVQQVLARADGVPLYLEEITKAVVEAALAPAGAGDRPSLNRPIPTIPATLQDSLDARLDRLGASKPIAQLAATLGRAFRFELLRAVAVISENELRAELERLVGAELLFRHGEPPNETYVFRHALIQDAAYESLLRSSRQRYHRTIAQTLASQFPELADAQPELLAQHFAGAGLAREAIRFWAQTGQRAIARSAYSEAIDTFQKAIGQLMTLPPSTERDRQEVELQSGLGLALLSIKGWSAKEVEQTYARAHELCRTYGDLPIRVLFGVWAVYLVRGDREGTSQLLPQIWQIIECSRDQNELFIAKALVGGHAFWSANYAEAARQTEAAKHYCDRREPRRQAIDLLSNYGYEGLLYPHVFGAWTDVIQARARAAASGMSEALEIAEATGNPYVIAGALAFSGAVAHNMNDVQAIQERGERLIELATVNGFPFFLGNGLCFTGWAKFKRGDLEGGLAAISKGIEIYRAVGSDVVVSYYLSYAAEVCLAAGKIDEGLAAVEAGLSLCETNLAVFCAPELHRLRGELLARKGDRAGAEGSLRQGRSLAAQQGATLFEARSIIVLARQVPPLAQDPDLLAHAHRVLELIHPSEPLVERKDLLDLMAVSALATA